LYHNKITFCEIDFRTEKKARESCVPTEEKADDVGYWIRRKPEKVIYFDSSVWDGRKYR
jgi:hypothetical protein